MQNEQTPAAGPLTAESVALLKKGDWLLHPAFGATQFEPDPFSKIDENWSFLGRPNQDGWIAWHGGENPVPGVRVDVRFRDGETRLNDQHSDKRWRHDPTIFLRFHIAAYRPHVPSPASSSSAVQGDASGSERAHGPKCWGTTSFSDEVAHCYCGPSEDRPQPSGETREAVAEVIEAAIVRHDPAIPLDSTLDDADAILALIRPAPVASSDQPEQGGGMEAVAWPVVTDQWTETYCELTGRDPDGKQVTFVDGGTVTTFRDVAKREIEAMLCAAPKSAVRAIAAAEPAEARVQELTERVEYLRKSRDGHAAASHAEFEKRVAAEAQLAKAKEALEEARTELEVYEQERSGETYNNPKLNQALAALQEAEGKA